MRGIESLQVMRFLSCSVIIKSSNWKPTKKIQTFYLPLLLNICSSKNLTIRPRIHSFVFLLIRFSISNHFDIFNHLIRWGEFISIWRDSIRFGTSGTISGTSSGTTSGTIFCFFKGRVISKSIFNLVPFSKQDQRNFYPKLSELEKL